MTEEVRSKFVGETKPVSQKETTIRKQAIETDYSLQKEHTVGLMVHNLHSAQRVMQKTNFGHQFRTENLTEEEKALV